MDPMNWYNSKPNTAPAYQPAKSQGLMAAPNGQQTLGTVNIGGNSGGRPYVPNQFQNPMPQASTPGLTAPMGPKSNTLPSGPVKGNMGFGGGQQGLWNGVASQFVAGPQQGSGNMQQMSGYNPMQNTQVAGAWQNVANQFVNRQANPQMQNQMIQASAVRNGGRVM